MHLLNVNPLEFLVVHVPQFPFQDIAFSVWRRLCSKTITLKLVFLTCWLLNEFFIWRFQSIFALFWNVSFFMRQFQILPRVKLTVDGQVTDDVEVLRWYVFFRFQQILPCFLPWEILSFGNQRTRRYFINLASGYVFGRVVPLDIIFLKTLLLVEVEFLRRHQAIRILDRGPGWSGWRVDVIGRDGAQSLSGRGAAHFLL